MKADVVREPPLPAARVQCITAVGQQVFAGTRQAGVFVSKDSGGSWRQLARGLTDLNVRSLVNLGPEVYAGTDEQGVFVLARGAESWDQLGRGLPEHSQVFDLAVSGQSVYAALYSKGLYRLNSGGEQWTKVGQVTPLEFLVQAQRCWLATTREACTALLTAERLGIALAAYPVKHRFGSWVVPAQIYLQEPHQEPSP